MINNTVKFNQKPLSSSFKSALSGYKVNPNYSSSGSLSSPNIALLKKTNPTSTVAPKVTTPAVSTYKPPVNAQSLQQQAQNIQSNLNQSVASGQISNNNQIPQNNTKVKGLVTPTAPSFPSLVSNLVGASNPNKTQTGLVQNVRDTARGNTAIGDEAKRISEQYGNEINRVGQLGAGAVAGNLSTGSNVVGTGNANLAAQSVSARMNALAQAQEAALKGTGQQLTAQDQMANAYGTALSGANTQQGQQISGLGTAAGYGQPLNVGYNAQILDPFTGQPTGGGSNNLGIGGYANYNTAEQVMGLISQYPDAGYSYNQNLTPQQNLQAAQQAIQSSPTYQRSTYGTPGQNTVQGATVVQTAQQGYSQSLQEYNQLLANYQNADEQATNALNIMRESGINPTDLKVAGKKIAEIKRQLSSVQQQKFDTALQEAVNAFSGIVNSYGGQPPTEVTAAMARIIDPNSSIGAIDAALTQLKKAGSTRLGTEYQRVQGYYGQLGGGQSSGSISWEDL